MGVPLPNFKPQFFDVNGDPLSGGLLYTYVAGSSTAATTYSDFALATPNANPIVLDSRGECNCYLADGAYKFVLKDSSGTTLWTVDNYTAEDFSATSTLLTKYTIGYADIAAAATTDTETILALPQNTVIEMLVIKASEAFAGGSISALTMDIGDATDADELAASFDLVAAVSATNFQIISAPYVQFTTTNIIASFTATGDNLDQLTAGSVDIWIKTKALGA